jgi:membrane protein implicated in regulation of membrane protease activity
VSEPLKAGDRVRWCKAWLDRMHGNTPGLISLAGPAARRGTVVEALKIKRGVKVLWDGNTYTVRCMPDMVRRCRDGE